MADTLTLTIQGKDFVIDWDKSRDPTPDEIAAISRSIADREFGAQKPAPGRSSGKVSTPGPVYGPPSPKVQPLARGNSFMQAIGVQPKANPGRSSATTSKPSTQPTNPLLDAIQGSKPLVTQPAAQPKAPRLDDTIAQRLGLGANAQEAKRNAEIQTKRNLLTPGTLEWAMSQVDQTLKPDAKRRQYVKDYLSVFGGEKLDEALALAQNGKYDYMRALSNPQATVDKLPFRIDVFESARRGANKVKTHTGGYISYGHAEKIFAKAVGLSVEELRKSGNLRAALHRATTQPERVKDEDELLNPVDQLLADAVPDDNMGIYLRSLPAAFEVFPSLLQDVAGRAFGMERGATIKDEGIQNDAIGKIGKGVFGIGKYILPQSAPYAIGGDIMSTIQRGREVGPLDAAKETLSGVLESANVFDEDIDTPERIARGINAVLLTAGVTVGARGAYLKGKKSLAIGELSKKTGMSRAEISEALKGMERSVADEFLKSQKGKDFGVGFAPSKYDKPEPALTDSPDVLGDSMVLDAPDKGKTQGKANEVNEPEQVLEQPNMIKPRPGRIMPDPVEPGSGKILNPAEILRRAQAALNKTIHAGRPDAPRAYGTYRPSNERVTIRFGNDLDTAAHELAHALDDRFPELVGNYKGPRQKSPFDDELFLPEFTHTQSKRMNLATRRSESVAEFIRAYVINPAEASRLAPKFTAHFERTVNAETLQALRQFGNDIRRYAGASSKHKVRSNIIFKDPDALSVENVANKVRDWAMDMGNEHRTPLGSKIKAKLTNRLDPMVKGVEEALKRQGIGNLLPENDPRILATAHAYVNQKVEDILLHGTVDNKGRRVGKAFATILQPLFHGSQNKKFDFERDVQDLATLLVSERTMEKIGLMGNERVVNFGAGFWKNSDIADEAIRELMQDPERFSRLAQAAQSYREWADDILRYAVDQGRITKADYTRIKASNQYYAAMNRIVEQSPFAPKDSRNLGRVKEVTKKFKGSSKPVRDPFVSLIEQAATVISEADRNNVLVQFTNLLKGNRRMNDGPSVDLAAIGTQIKGNKVEVGGHKAKVFKVYRNGKVENWVFDEDIERALSGIGAPAPLPRWVTALPQFVRGAITHSPAFAIKNLLRDTLERSVQSTTGAGLKDLAKPLQPGELSQYRLYGGGMGPATYIDGPVNYYKVQRKLMSDMLNDKKSILITPGRWLERYKTSIESAERKGRVAEMRSARREGERRGYDEHNANLFAAHKSRELIDFAVSGEWTRVLNQIAPFTSAQVRGVARTFTVAADEPGKFAARVAKYVMLPSAMQRAWNESQGAHDEYLQLPAYMRAQFFNLKVGDVWLRIPKPHTVGVLSTALDYGEYAKRGEAGAFPEFMKELARSMTPLSQETFAGGAYSTLLEGMTNNDFFRDKPIVPPYEAGDKLLRLREGQKYASRLGQMLAKVFPTDARAIDHYIENVGGDFGRAATTLSDLGRDQLTTKARLAQLGTGLVVEPPGANARDVQYVIKLADAYGIQRNRLDPAFKAAWDKYYKSKSDKDKYAAGERLRAVGTRMRQKLERAQKEGRKDEVIQQLLQGK